LLLSVTNNSRSIEDNVLVTKDGSENLTTAIKEPAEIEALISA
jgi:Xaa-Pro dipeptidase